MKILLLIAFLIVSHFNYGQNTYGFGWNTGNRSMGPKLEMCSKRNFALEAGIDWQRYNIFALYSGFSICLVNTVFDTQRKNSLWIGSSFNHSIHGDFAIEKDSRLYQYEVNDLNRVVGSLIFRRRLNGLVEEVFGVLGFSISYYTLLNDLRIIQTSNAEFVSPKVERSLVNYFGNGLGFNISFSMFFGKEK